MQTSVNSDLQQAIAAHRQGNFQEAERYYKLVIRAQPLHPDANHNLGVLAVCLNRTETAIPFFKTALNSDPKIEQFWVSYINALIRLNRINEAETLLTRAKLNKIESEKLELSKLKLAELTNYLDHLKTALSKFQALHKRGRFKEALVFSLNIEKRFPFEFNILNTLGENFILSHNYIIAIKKFKKAILVAPDQYRGYFSLGTALYSHRDYKNATLSFIRVIILERLFVHAHSNLSSCFIELEHYGGATKHSKKALVLEPSFSAAYNNFGVSKHREGARIEAAQIIKRATLINLEYCEAYVNLANSLFKIGKQKAAIANYQKALLLQPNDPSTLNNHGNSLKSIEKSKDAEASYRRALSIDPDVTEFQKNLAELYKTIGDHDKALSICNSFEALAQSALALECLYALGRHDDFRHATKIAGSKNKRDLRIAAISAFASNQTNSIDLYPFCPDPLEYISVSSVLSYEGVTTDFFEKVIQESEERNLIWQPRTTKFGYQTSGNIFADCNKDLTKLSQIISTEIGKYHLKFKDSSCAFIKNWPSQIKLFGWYNRLEKNGYQSAHIHPYGWLSGVIYLRTVDFAKKYEGAIEFSLQGLDYIRITPSNPKVVHQPKKGDLVLFPSSVFHKTLPFKSETTRCVIAFDIIP
tara:strand:+ start:181 stop:2112 length:1932 start_codon:yes stop_codon:yes gene_type:complete